MRSIIRMSAFVAALASAIALPLHAQTPTEAPLLETLKKADAPQKDKFDACRELARLGSKDAVPVLAALLGDETYAHMARYGLEPNPDPSVDAAFRDALPRLKGKLLVGVINSIGVRQDEKAVPALAGLLKDADAAVVFAAGSTLGRIASKEAVAALAKDLPEKPGVLADACLRAAENLRTKGRDAEAAKLFDQILAVKGPDHVRLAATRGAIVARGTDGIALMTGQLKGADPIGFIAALRAAQEGKGSKWSKALAQALPDLQPQKQIQVLQTLGFRHDDDDTTVEAVLAAARTGMADVRLAAIAALTMIGDEAAIPSLLALANDADETIAKAARASLASFPGKEANNAIAALLKSPDTATRRAAIDLLGQRRAKAALPKIAKAATDDNAGIRSAAVEALGRLGGEAELTTVLDALLQAKSPQEAQSAETALAALCLRLSVPAATSVKIRKAVYGDLPDGKQADVTDKVAALVKQGTMDIFASNDIFGDPADGKVKKLRVDYEVGGGAGSKTVGEQQTLSIPVVMITPKCADPMFAAFASAGGETKLALLRIMKSLGGAKSLEAVRAAAADANAELRGTAQRALCDWPTADALPDLLKLVSSGEGNVKILALRGAIRLVPLQDASAADKAKQLGELLKQAARAEEKKQALAALGECHAVESLALVAPCIGNAELREEAALAAVSISEKIAGRHPAEVKAAMEQVVNEAKANNTKKRAGAVLAQVKN